jgi:N-acetylglucosamine malate deacetylase 1
MHSDPFQVDLLAIAAHPDDVELSAAGIMLVAKRAGKRTAILDLTRGELSTRGTLESRAKETDAATKILGLDHRMNLEIPDGNVEVSQDNLLKVVRCIRAYRPTILLSPHREERHPDHEHASALAHQAFFFAGLAKIETIGWDGNPQQPHRPLLALEYMQTYTFQPTIIIDVSTVFEERMEAMQAYRTQFARPKNQSSRVGTEFETASDKAEPGTFISQAGYYEFIEGRARHYGMIIGAEFGEPFWSHETLGVKDPFSLVTKRVS